MHCIAIEMIRDGMIHLMKFLCINKCFCPPSCLDWLCSLNLPYFFSLLFIWWDLFFWSCLLEPFFNFLERLLVNIDKMIRNMVWNDINVNIIFKGTAKGLNHLKNPKSVCYGWWLMANCQNSIFIRLYGLNDSLVLVRLNGWVIVINSRTSF